MSRLQDSLRNQVQRQEEYQEEPIEQVQPKVDNPHTLYKDMQENPIPEGVLPETLGSGLTLDFSCLEKYNIFVQTPRKMRNYMRYQKAITIEDIKGFSKKPRGKFDWKIILIIGGAIVAIGVGFMILTNPDAITNALSGFMPKL